MYPDTNKSLPIDVDDDLTVAHHHHHHTHNDDVADDDAIDDDAPSEKSSGKRRRRTVVDDDDDDEDKRYGAVRMFTQTVAAMACRQQLGLLPGPPLALSSNVSATRRRSHAAAAVSAAPRAGARKRAAWLREAGEWAARRREDDVGRRQFPRTARSGSRAGSQVTGSAASRVTSAS